MSWKSAPLLIGLFVIQPALANGEITNCSDLNPSRGKKQVRTYTSPYQGDVFCVSLPRKKKIEKLKNGKTRVSYESKVDFRVRVFGKEHSTVGYFDKQVAFIGVDYQQKPGRYPLHIFLILEALSDNGIKKETVFGPIQIMITVKKKYPKSNYRPPIRTEEQQKKVNQESEQLKSVLKSTSPYVVGELAKFRLPLPLDKIHITSHFIDKRPLGCKKNCRYHAALDFRSAFDEKRSVAEDVFPINNGLVVDVSTYTAINAGIVMTVDHGAGVKSSYSHLSKPYYQKGQLVTPNKPLARSGSTGADSTHLHLVMTVNGETVDPEKFLGMFFNFKKLQKKN